MIGVTMSFTEVNPETLKLKPYKAFDYNWALLTAGTPDDFNTMTIGWGMIGSFWTHSAVTVYVRESRYTKEFMDKYDSFSVCFFNRDAHEDLKYLGTTSGRDTDKLANTKLTPITIDNTVCFEESRLILTCTKVASTKIDNDAIYNNEMYEKWYTGNDEDDFHTAYIGFVNRSFTKDM